MNTYRIEKTVPKSRTITIDKLPFRAGQMIEIVVRTARRSRNGNKRYPLRGKLLRYIDPFEPVAQDDWEANK